MKHFINIVSIGLGILLFASCEDFIDKQPLSDFTSEGNTNTTLTSKYKNLNEAETDLNGAYSKFKQDIFQLENYIMSEVQSDNCYLGADEVAAEEIENLHISSLNFKIGLNWGQYYGMAGTATTVIENTKLMEAGTIDNENRKRIIAEAKFIRAYAYFDIVRFWGDAPMILDLLPEITVDNIDEVYPIMYPKRTPEAEIYEQVVNDLETAIPDLVSTNKGAFKATKGAAYALLAKVLATKGVKATRDYSKVVEYCDLVIKEGYQLVSDYESLWLPDNKFTSESIFEVYYTSDASNWAYWVLLKETDGTVTWRRYCTPTHELLAKYKSEDKRLTSSFIFKSVPYQVHYPSKSYPLAYKIREKNSDIILMRLADVLLLKAEALVELNKVNLAMPIVNEVRQRAGLTDLEINLSQDKARLAVETERQLELVLEGHRWFDLLRNDRMVEVMSKHKDKNGNLFLPEVKPFRAHLPIPQSEKDKNVNLTQNEGY